MFLISRALSGLVLGLLLIAGGLMHLYEAQPVWFWSIAAAFGLLAALWISGRRIQRREMAERLCDKHVPSMSPLEYEQFVARQLKAAGWSVEHTGRTGDQGCDVLAELRGIRAVVQVTKARAGNGKVQEVIGARHHYGAQIMVVVALGFTPAARQLAHSNGVHLMFHGELGKLACAAKV